MLTKSPSRSTERIIPRKVDLWLEGQFVGKVTVCRRQGSWYFGRFAPATSFGKFAGAFSRWASLMHGLAEDPLTETERVELAVIERSNDRLRAWVAEPGGARRPIAQLNIDGNLIEWKERL